MDNEPDIQIQLIQRIRDGLPGHLSLVDEIAEVLEISTDSAYRRIRGEKPLSLQEVQKLVRTYNLSLDDLLDGRKATVTFQASFLDERSYSFSDWMAQLYGFTRIAAGSGDNEAVFILNELNIFHLIQFPELLAFKLFFWQKSNLDFPSLQGKKFLASDMPDDIARLSRQIADEYVKINTIEFTTEESLNSILKQMLYYSESGYFGHREDALRLCSELHLLVDHQQVQAELGYKFRHGGSQSGREGNLKLFYNDLVLADNTVMVRAGETRATFITSNAINLMQTYNSSYYDYCYRWGRNLQSKSVPISGTAEKARNRFFRQLRDQIDRVADRI